MGSLQDFCVCELQLEETAEEQAKKNDFHFDEERHHLIKCLVSPEDGFCKQVRIGFF